MNVIFIRSNSIDPDPRVEKQALALSKKGYKVSILGWDRSASQSKESYKIIGGYHIPIKKCQIKSSFGSGIKNIIPLFIFQIFILYNLFCKRNEYNIIHAADFDTVLPALLIKLIFKKKIIYDIYDFYVDAFPIPRILKSLVRRLDFYAINKSDSVILVNESRIEQIKGSRPKNLSIIHNTPECDCKYDGKSNDSTNKKNTFAYVGVLQNNRLLEEIIEIFSEHNNFNLKIAGFGPLEKKIIEASRTYKNIEYFGRVSYEVGLAISASADFLFATYDPMIPNHKYSSPNKMYEAMMLAKPIVVCKNTGVDDLVYKNKIGYVTDYSKDGFLKALKYFSHINIDEYNEMCSLSRKLYESDFSWELMEKRLINIYLNI